MNIYEKLNVAREKFHQSKLTKSGHNKFAGYKYFELGDFLVPALQIFKEVGITSIISFGKEIAQMRVINTEKPGEMIVIESPMSEAHLKGTHPIQNLGAVQTYLRRYLWVAALEIVEHDALDATTGGSEPEFKLSESQLADLIALVDESSNMAELKANYQQAIKACKSDQHAQKVIIFTKDAKKASMEA